MLLHSAFMVTVVSLESIGISVLLQGVLEEVLISACLKRPIYCSCGMDF